MGSLSYEPRGILKMRLHSLKNWYNLWGQVIAEDIELPHLQMNFCRVLVALKTKNAFF
jgi:hypothetical protein